jgi:hypothetical protein
MSRDYLYYIFFINHILLVSLEVLYEDFKFRRIFAVLFNLKGESELLGVAYAGKSGLTSVGFTGMFELLGVAYTSESRSSVWPTQGTPQKFFLKKAYLCRLHRGVWTHWCRLHWQLWTHQCRLHRRIQTPWCSLCWWVISPTFNACQCS